MRQRRLRKKPFNYGAVGTTRPTDRDRAHPSEHRVTEDAAHIGEGQAHWDYAWRQTLTWGIQRYAGYSIRVVESGSGYALAHAHGGSSAISGSVQAGRTVLLERWFGPLRMRMPVRIVYVIDEPALKGFAFGTLRGHPVSGEVAFLVERSADGSIVLKLRTFSGPGRGAWALVYPLVLLLRRGIRNTYFAALAGPMTESADTGL